MAFQIIIIDDEPLSLADSKRVVEGLGRADITVQVFTGVARALEYVDKQQMVALILCDVEMPGTDGFSAVTLLGDKCQRFVYLTGHAEHLDEANDTDADAFLLKPLRERQLLRQITKLSKSLRAESDGDMLRFVNDGSKRRQYAVSIPDITHVEGAKDYIIVHTPARSYVVHHTLKGFLKEPGITGRFIRIHKSIIVRVESIRELGEGMVTLHNGDSFVIGPAYAEQFNAFWKARMLGKHKPDEEF
ncbi:DNA-binding response regulator [Parapedobacter defluvii]|uniref:DNA-binding response regulator n=1 Tax=Parapedobacter defluvii TaxID=2045106 RepID=A0ABQ1MCW3_9SPHI|nr:LytTR family DNA-binding domain-containing protein [Parapedobacter defluvii]GGC38467.1 DNA-binding response regulator [Parapedobacter defluvii]